MPDQPVADEEPVEEPKPKPKSKVAEPKVAVRTSANAWWCPEDGTSMPHDLKQCATCGYTR